MAESNGQTLIDVNSLGIEELTNLQKQFDTEVNFFNESLNELKNAAGKFGRCQATVESMDPQDKNKEALIPLSESVYIKARIPNPDDYLVEIGTGYFVQMSRQQATDHFHRKYAFIDAQMSTITQKIIPEKQQARQAIVAALQKKVQQAYGMADGAQ